MSDLRGPGDPRHGPPRAAAGLVPLYRRISDDLLRGISARRLQPGDALPTETELCAAYGASRITIRKAVDELVARNVVVRRRGSGTYLADAERVGRAVLLTGSLDDVLMPNRVVVLEEGRGTLPDRLAAFARVEEAKGFKRIVGVNHVAPDAPIVHIAFWFPPGIARGVRGADVAGPLPTIRHVERAHGLRVDHADQVMDAVSAPAPVAAALGIGRGAPVLRASRAYFDTGGALMEIFEAHYHPTRYGFSATLYPRHA